MIIAVVVVRLFNIQYSAYGLFLLLILMEDINYTWHSPNKSSVCL